MAYSHLERGLERQEAVQDCAVSGTLTPAVGADDGNETDLDRAFIQHWMDSHERHRALSLVQ